MRKIITILLAFVLLVGSVPLVAEAATATSKSGAVTTDGMPLNVRSGASTSSSIVATLKKGSYITLISKSGAWWQVEYAKGRFGYCHGDYITIVEGTPATVTSSNGLNIRSGAGTGYSRIGGLAKGETILRLSTSGGWSRVLYHGTKTGYVSAQYLSGGTSNTPSSNAINLTVPYFKQTDSRWANVKIGASGKTFAQIGCATTAIAMMESYRTGTTIYPNAMAQKLNYTSSGNVYWPSHYVTVTDSTNYLSRIYELLKQGKPVLFGARNNYGTQHWVVITGFTGGSVAAESFSINDPGTGSRTNLRQFLNAYPTFYKYFYY